VLAADGIPVHVVAFGDATMQPSLNEVALQGGTGKAIDATSPQGIIDALSSVLDKIRDSVIVPECTAGLPRMLVIMDGSSSMIEGNAAGETKWDKARFALTGNPAAPNPGDPGYVEPVFSREIDIGGRKVAIEDVVHLGMTTFAGADEQKLLVNFGPCMRDNFAWAMDPATSCEAPGCTDPYAGFPIEWTFKDSDKDKSPPFVRHTLSYMPACNQTSGSTSCVGSVANTFTGQGLAFAQQVIDDYKKSPAPFSADAQTRYVNVLVTDGKTSTGSSDVQGALQGMATAGIQTFVIGFGTSAELDEAQLGRYAQWGGTANAIIVDPTAAGGAGALADALEGVVRGLSINSCCVLQDCSAQAEPSDPRPVCGDGRIEGDEVCDDGPLNASYDHCGGLCTGPHLFCGDGRTDAPESCDDGNLISGDGCGAGCVEEGDDGGVTEPPSRPPVLPPSTGGTGGVRPRDDDGGLDAGLDGGLQARRDGGCGCRTVGTGRPSPRAWFALPLLLLGLCRGRQRHTARTAVG
jgi:MYXO-CTERM domain-containing protein